MSWEEVPPIDQNGIITDYEVLLEPLETFDGLDPITSNTTNFDIEIMDLMPFVSYNISVRAYTSEGPGPYSEPMSNTTSEEGTILLCEILLDSVSRNLHAPAETSVSDGCVEFELNDNTGRVATRIRTSRESTNYC